MAQDHEAPEKIVLISLIVTVIAANCVRKQFWIAEIRTEKR